MIEIFVHKTDQRFFYTRLSGEVTIEYVDIWAEEFYKFVGEKKNCVVIQDYTHAFLVDKNSNAKAAKVSKKIAHLLSDSVYVGLKGIQKFFFKLYIVLAPAKGFKRHIVNTTIEFEELFKVKFSDFERSFIYED